MTLISYGHDADSVILRVKILDSSVATGAGKTGLSASSSGLIVSTIADNEATPTAYTEAAGNIETIATLGTYAAPTAGKCRFAEVDATNHPGVYEIQLADARFAVSSAKSLLVSISGATDAAECDALVPLVDRDPYADVADTYWAEAKVTVDGANTRDEYTVMFHKNDAPVTSGVTSPTIEVKKRADGTALVSSTPLTEAGSSHVFTYNEATNRITAGEAVAIFVTATIDGATRNCPVIVGSRDS